MKKLFYPLSVFLLIACGELDQNKPNQAPEIIAVQAPSFIQFSDTVRIQAYDADGDPVLINVDAYENNGNFIISPFLHFPNDSGSHGDRTADDLEFTGILKQSFLSGVSTSRFYFYFYAHDGKNESEPTIIIISQNPAFGRPPVISNLNMPDTINTSEITEFKISIRAIDEDGQDDIKSVTRLTPSGIIAYLNDLGQNGDTFANDSLYTETVTLLPNPPPNGIYVFKFQAIDKEGIMSNTIIDSIVVIN